MAFLCEFKFTHLGEWFDGKTEFGDVDEMTDWLIASTPRAAKGEFIFVSIKQVERWPCQFCGVQSARHPSEQVAPPDYCHPEDHEELI